MDSDSLTLLLKSYRELLDTESFKLVLSNLNADQSTAVNITDVSGRLVKQYQYDATAEFLQFGQDLTNGIYFVTVEQGDAKSVTRIVKTN